MHIDKSTITHLHPELFQKPVTEPQIRAIFEACDALWLHNGDPKAPHAELTTGKCSDGFVDTLRVLKHTNLCVLLAHELRRKIQSKLGKVDWVIGSDHAGATFSYELARQIGVQHDFTEKGPDKEVNGKTEKTQVWKRFVIKPDEVVLQAEELVTTAATLQAVRSGIREGNPSPVTFAPFVATLIHRSSVYEFEGNPILYLVHYDINVWDPSECPLCAGGSERVKPKKNWAKLTGK